MDKFRWAVLFLCYALGKKRTPNRGRAVKNNGNPGARRARTGATAEPGDSSSVILAYFPPPEELQPFLTTLYSLTSAEPQAHDVMPSGVGYLQIFITGSGELEFVDGRRSGSMINALITPSTAAAIAHISGPCVTVGAALSPLGWAALTKLPADKHCDQAYDAETHLGPELTALTAQLREDHAAGTADSRQIALALASFIGARLRPVNSRHARLIGQVAEWLSSSFDPPLSQLIEAAPYSERQLQRLVERYFGVSPKHLVRKYRALRVAAMLQSPDTSDEQVAELVNLFYDQSHMIREMRHFLGRTPTRLGSDETPLLSATSGMRNYREVRPNVARMPGD
jgi:AraC-like DNA-binding protein